MENYFRNIKLLLWKKLNMEEIIKEVLVHGGEPDIEEELKNKKNRIKVQNGLRITDKKMDVVKMVLVWKTNTEIVNMLNMQ